MSRKPWPNPRLRTRFGSVAITLSIAILAVAACAGSDQSAADKQALVKRALEGQSAHIVEQQLARIPEGTPGRGQVIAHLRALQEKQAADEAAQAAAAEEARRRADKRQAEEARLEEERFLKTKAGQVWAKHKNWSREICEVIAQRKIRVGMTADQVRAAWGKPETINSSVYASGTDEQWVYGSGSYVYFENGVMTSLQQSR